MQNQLVDQTAFSVPKSKKWIYVFIVLFVLILVPAGLIFAHEKNYLNFGLDKYYNKIGLEKIWNGLPINPKLAAPKVAKKMENIQKLHFDSSFTFTFDQDAIGNIPQITQKIPQLAIRDNEKGKVLGENIDKSAEIRMGFAGDYAGLEKSAATLSFSTDSTSLGILSALDIDVRTIDNKIYLRLPALSILSSSAKNKWLAIDMGQYKTKVTRDYFADFLSVIKSGERLQEEDIKGKNTYHFRVTLDKNKLNELYQEANISKDPEFEIWVGKKDHQIYKAKGEIFIQEDVSNSQIIIKGQASLSNFNENFNIEAPQKEEVYQEGINEILKSNFGIDYSADNVRKTDIKAIQILLEKYKVDNGKYPIVSEADKTNNKDGVLNQSLVPKYAKSLPIDPLDPKYWYGYVSDGQTYKLWCILENREDPEGKTEGDLHKYIIEK